MSTTTKTDPIFGMKSVRTAVSNAKSLKNGARVTITVTAETAANIVNQLTSLLEANQEGNVILDVHYGQKSKDGATFTSGFFFVRAPMERGAGSNASTSAPKKFTPKSAAVRS